MRVGGLLAAAVLGLSACSAAGPQGSAAPSGSPAGRVAEPDQGTASGEQTLSFSATTLEGDELDVSTLAGQPVVLWFWTPWCTICRAEAPEVARVARDLEGQVTFLGVPGLGPEADMREFVADTGTGGIGHLVDSDGSLWQRFGVVSQPSYVFVAPDGSAKAFSGALGGDELQARAESLVGG